MAKKSLRTLWFMLICLSLIGCAAQKVTTVSYKFEPYTFETGRYAPKVDNFLVILDMSSSMGEPYGVQTKLSAALDFLNAMNLTIPDLKLNGALRTFGHHASISRKLTELAYGIKEYSQAELEAALQSLNMPGGTSALHAALDAGAMDLEATRGKIAVIVVSDGKNMDSRPLAAAEDMKQRYGERLCIYTVLMGDDTAGEKLLRQIADAGQCGFTVRADSFTNENDMADFVEEVFLTRAKPLDSDGDGVYDDLDQCPNTPRGVPVDSRGCPLDTDGDGVYDYLDKCPGTPAGVKVDRAGCPLDLESDSDGDGVLNNADQCPGTPWGAKVNESGCWVIEGVYFDFGSSNIKSAFYPVLDGVVEVLRKNPNLKVEIHGHTDNIGPQKLNQKLSENRANAVMNYILDRGIQPWRLSAKGYGFSNPVAPNTTREGRAKNRRVELKPNL